MKLNPEVYRIAAERACGHAYFLGVCNLVLDAGHEMRMSDDARRAHLNLFLGLFRPENADQFFMEYEEDQKTKLPAFIVKERRILALLWCELEASHENKEHHDVQREPMR